jgi:hypothetical protein
MVPPKSKRKRTRPIPTADYQQWDAHGESSNWFIFSCLNHQ